MADSIFINSAWMDLTRPTLHFYERERTGSLRVRPDQRCAERLPHRGGLEHDFPADKRWFAISQWSTVRQSIQHSTSRVFQLRLLQHDRLHASPPLGDRPRLERSLLLRPIHRLRQ